MKISILFLSLPTLERVNLNGNFILFLKNVYALRSVCFKAFRVIATAY